MRKLFICYLVILLSLTAFSGMASSNRLETVRNFDLTQYMGKWYEIALLPNHFQKNCQCTTAQYALKNNHTMSIRNRCLKINQNRFTEALGKGWIPNKNEPSKLKIRFIWPFSGDYWILYLQNDYQYVLVGSPSHNYLWILSRKKAMPAKIYQKLINIARAHGFDPNKIHKTKQNCSN